MEKILLKDPRNEILEKCKVDKSNVSFILDLAKLGAKRGRKAYADMSDDELYEAYVKKCERQGHPVLNKETWLDFQVMYEYEDLLTTEDIEEKDFRYQPEPKSVRLGYIGDELDYEAIDSLYKLLFKALKKRLVIILDLEGVPSIINSALRCRYQGYDCKGVNALMNAKLTETRQLLENPDVTEWLNSGVSDMSHLVLDDYRTEKKFKPTGKYIVNEYDILIPVYKVKKVKTKYKLDLSLDYIRTYQKVLRQLTDIKDESLEFIRDIIHNDEDIFEDEILKNEDIEISYFSENIDYDEEDEDILD